MGIDWGAIFAPPPPPPQYDLPVGEACMHHPKGLSHIYAQPNYAEDDNGGTIYYHSYHRFVDNNEVKLEWCGKMEPWRWRFYAAKCAECNEVFSNPWVPVCESCWPGPGLYPSVQLIVSQERTVQFSTQD